MNAAERRDAAPPAAPGGGAPRRAAAAGGRPSVGVLRHRDVQARSRTLGVVLAFALAACAAPGSKDATADLPALASAWPAADLLLVGEQHDAALHQQRTAAIVERLAAEGRLVAVAMEMAEQGHSTAGLPRDADEARMRAALSWDERGWPWAAYGPIVRAAVRAGVPVVGANLPRRALRETMADAGLDGEVSAAVRAQLLDDVRDGHCNLLPSAHLPGMTRVQIARDRAMARTLAALALARPDGVAMLVAGSRHVDRARGVPQHLGVLAPGLRLRTLALSAGPPAPGEATGFDEVWVTPPLQRPDPCKGLAERFAPPR